VQSADVFPGGRRFESLLMRQTDTTTDGATVLFQATEARVDEAFERINRLERRLQRLEADTHAGPQRELEYVLFFATPSGYRLVSAFGRLPAAGDRIDEDDAVADVLRVAASPLPGDRRPCVFAVAAPLGSPDAAEDHPALARRAA
jgi:hypothetical protein